MHNKYEVQDNIVNFKSDVKNKFKTSINNIRTDNGNEFAMKTFIDSKDII